MPLLAVRLGLQRFHVIVGQSEMVADFVDQDVAHQMAQVLTGFAPIGQDRLAVEKNAVLIVGRIVNALSIQGNAGIETQHIIR